MAASAADASGEHGGLGLEDRNLSEALLDGDGGVGQLLEAVEPQALFVDAGALGLRSGEVGARFCTWQTGQRGVHSGW